MDCWIVHHAEKFWQNFLADFLGESLAFFFVALAVAFQAVAQDFVEKHGGGAAAEKSGAVVGFGHRSFAEIAEVGGHFFDFGGEFAFDRKTFGARSLKSLNAKEVHAVFGAGLRF